MKRNLLHLLVGLGFLALPFGCQKTTAPKLSSPETTSPTAPTSSFEDEKGLAELDAFIQEKLLSEEVFEWKWASDEQVFLAAAAVDHVISVGYKPEKAEKVEERLHELDLKSAEWQKARQHVLDLVFETEKAFDESLESEKSLFAFDENPDLPVLNLFVQNPKTIEALRASGFVRYAEPTAYEPFLADRDVQDRSGSGCDGNPADPAITTADYTTIAPVCKQSWNHSFHKINQAWARSTGAGTQVMYIDTGCSDAQDNLGSAFNQGQSSGRTITKSATLPSSTPHDLCGHGTSMIGAGAAPRGTDGASVGIAYNMNVWAVRAAEDVYLDASSEIVGTSNAYTLAGNSTATKITSMSLGRLLSSSQLADAIRYAHGKGKLIFCAAGTSFWWTAWFAGVIFPASMTECVAVTGVTDQLNTRCSNCHSGSKVDFTVVMEKTSTGRNALTLAYSGDAPSTVGGSSVATASTAAMAALVWSKYPTWTRQQVFDRLKSSASNATSRHASLGWGRIDAFLATQ